MSYRRPLSTPTTGPRQGTGMDWRIGLEPVQWLIALGTGLAWLLVVGVLAGMTPAHASTAQPAAAASAPLETEAADAQGLEALVQSFARSEPLAATAGVQPRVEVILGALDSRIHLAPCKKVRTYWPSGKRAWGATHIGVRCEQGDVRWNVYWPVVVKVWVKGVVTQAPMQQGQQITAADLRMAEVDIAARNTPAVLQASELVGRFLSRSVAAGLGVRVDDLRPRRYFAPGEPVSLTVKGDGFAVAGQGTAITPGDEGQCARIRTDSGRVVCGTPVGERRAEITL